MHRPAALHLQLHPLWRPLRHLFAMAVMIAAVTTAHAAGTRQYTVTAPDGLPIAVQESGNADGAPIIFIHGLLGSRLSWDAQVDSPLLSRYRMITFDLRGHGQSGKPITAAAYTDGRRWADDLQAVIAATQARQPVLVGWSLGAAVASNYLAAYGDADIAGAIYVGGVIELTATTIVSHPDVYRDLASRDLKTWLDAQRTFVALCFATQPDPVTFQRLLANAAIASPVLQTAVPAMSIAARDGLGRMTKPLLLIYGAQDALVHALPSIARAKELNPAVRSTVYAASGHAPFVEEAERFNRDVMEFVEATRRQ
jgi:pimeloyl-ACP methyl ester carboxylesterase